MKNLTAVLAAAVLAACALTACASPAGRPGPPRPPPRPPLCPKQPGDPALRRDLEGRGPGHRPGQRLGPQGGRLQRQGGAGRRQRHPLWDIEFETEYGDYDFEVALSGGRIVGADYEVDDEWLDRLGGSPVTADEAKAILQSKAPGVEAGDIALREEHSDGRLRYEGEAYGGGIKYEFEMDAATGVIYDWNADLRE